MTTTPSGTNPQWTLTFTNTDTWTTTTPDGTTATVTRRLRFALPTTHVWYDWTITDSTGSTITSGQAPTLEEAQDHARPHLVTPRP